MRLCRYASARFPTTYVHTAAEPTSVTSKVPQLALAPPPTPCVSLPPDRTVTSTAMRNGPGEIAAQERRQKRPRETEKDDRIGKRKTRYEKRER